ALFTKPRSEHQVGEILGEKGIETYVPMIQVRRRGRILERPFFPRYMFVRLDFDHVGLSDVQWTPGLTRIVSLGNGPTPVPDDIIDRLKEQLEQLAREGTFSPFKPGDRVRIKSGLLQDFEAVFDTHLSATDRVRILVESLHNVRRVEIDLDDLEPL
ncbi:MAG: transcription termination/antitermination protein NusG, partial [Anaerolineae bacterium]